MDHAVHIYHWHYFEDKALSKGKRLNRVSHQEFKHSSHHPAPVCLTWMHSSRDYYAFLVFVGSLRSIWVRYRDYLNFVAS